jgi:hypothetical protein
MSPASTYPRVGRRKQQNTIQRRDHRGHTGKHRNKETIILAQRGEPQTDPVTLDCHEPVTAECVPDSIILMAHADFGTHGNTACTS